MNTSAKRVLFWTPRFLCIFIAGFLSKLALDVFGEGFGLWQTIGALLLHLSPTFIVVIALVIAWRWEWLGAALFGGLGVFFVVLSWERLSYLIMAGPLVLIGVLFLFNWIYRAQLRTR